MNLVDIIVALIFVYGIYRIVVNSREKFEEEKVPLYATLGTVGSLLVVGLLVYLVYNILSVKKLMSLHLIR